MFWRIEKLAEDGISGWIYDKDRLETDFELVVLYGDAILGRVVASEPRAHLEGQHPKTGCGFSLPLDGVEELARIRVLCLNADGRGRSLVVYSSQKEEIGTFLTTYQSFGDRANVAGASLSEAKLRALRLPSLQGLSVLDIGCNEGFFCRHAWLSGARRVVGMDSSELFIAKARLRFEQDRDVQSSDAAGRSMELHCASWWDVPDEKFDLILFLSAVHYEPEQKKLLDFLATRLTPGGMLVLECGVFPGAGRHWMPVGRAVDTRRFPTEAYLKDVLLSGYAVRFVGPSPQQGGDPVPRFVYYCTPRRPTAGIIRGASGSGKSVLSQTLGMYGVSAYSSDHFLMSYMGDNRRFAPQTPLYTLLSEGLERHALHEAPRRIIALDVVEEFCREFADCLPVDEPLFFVEGQIFSYKMFFDALKSELERRGVVVWDVTRS